MPVNRGQFVGLSLAAILLSCAGACGDYEIPLGHGFILVRTSPEVFAIVDPPHRVIAGPTVDRYRVHGDIVTGHVRSNGRETYFVIDMRTREAALLLTEGQWRQTLAQRGITDLTLMKPPRYRLIR